MNPHQRTLFNPGFGKIQPIEKECVKDTILPISTKQHTARGDTREQKGDKNDVEIWPR